MISVLKDVRKDVLFHVKKDVSQVEKSDSCQYLQTAQYSAAPVVNKEQYLYWRVGTGPALKSVLVQYWHYSEVGC